MKLLILLAVLLAGSSAFPSAMEEAEAEAPKEINPFRRGPDRSNFEDREWLVERLFEDYDKKLHPDQPNFEMSVTLIDFKVLAESNRLESDVWLCQQWTDERFRWNEEDFGGISLLQLPYEEVWSPDVTLWNTPDQERRMRCWNPNVLIYSNGQVLWIPPCEMASICNFNRNSSGELDGYQTCSMKFGSWTYDGWTMDENLMNRVTGIDLTELRKNPKYEVVSSSAERNEKYYDCCEEPYLSLAFNFTIKAIN